MKAIKKVVLVAVVLTITYLMITAYTNKIEKIENGEITQISESYMDR